MTRAVLFSIIVAGGVAGSSLIASAESKDETGTTPSIVVRTVPENAASVGSDSEKSRSATSAPGPGARKLDSSQRKSIFLIATTTGVLLGIPLLAWLSKQVMRARKRAEFDQPRETMAVPVAKALWTPQLTANEATPPERRRDPVPAFEDAHAMTAFSPPEIDSPRRAAIKSNAINSSKERLLKVATLLGSSPLANRLRLITSMEAIVEDVEREVTSTSPASRY
jgi:hypothetical protein